MWSPQSLNKREVKYDCTKYFKVQAQKLVHNSSTSISLAGIQSNHPDLTANEAGKWSLYTCPGKENDGVKAYHCFCHNLYFCYY